MKKITASIIICTALATTSAFGINDNLQGITTKASSFEIVKPEAEYATTTNEKILISIKGAAKDSGVMQILTKKDGKFTNLVQKKNIEIGPLGLFITEITLTEGENKVVFDFGNDTKEKIIKFTKISNNDDDKRKTEVLKDKGIKDIFNNMITTIK